MITSFKRKFAWLSNFHWYRVNGRYETTVEHQFQAAKTTDFWAINDILHAETPSKAKRAGRKCALRSDWEQIKDKVMLTCLRRKFRPGTSLAKLLVGTGDQTLVEGNHWHDNYWGSCMCRKCGNKGQNKLGLALMQVREELLVRAELGL